jgi:hypothetical protein
MKRTIRTLVAVVGAVAAVGLLAGTSAAQSDRAPTLRPGVSDFELSYGSLRPIGPVSRAGESGSQQELKPGVRDFGGSYSYTVSPSAPADGSTPSESVDGFDWTDAGIGAAATLGAVLLVGGLGAWLLLRGHRRELRSA